MEGECFLKRAAIVHGGIAARYCYYMVIHLFLSGMYLAQSQGDDEKMKPVGLTINNVRESRLQCLSQEGG